jgi:transcriptional regulator with XRE-family HTH domain
MYRALGAKVRARRIRVGLRQSDLAASCGLTRASICNIETRGQKPTLHTLCLMADALDTTPESLLKGVWP